MIIRKKKLARYPVVSSLSLASVRDAAGFNLGVVWQSHQNQATIYFSAEGWSRQRVLEWVASVSTVEGVLLVGVRRSNYDATAQAWATFDTKKAKQDDFLVSLAIKAPSVYAPQEGLVWHPADEKMVVGRINQVVAPENSSSFPPKVQITSECVDSLELDGETIAAFEVEVQSDKSVVDDIIRVCETLAGVARFQWVELFRPTDPVYLDSHNDAGLYRESMVLLVSGGPSDSCEEAVARFFFELSARVRLRITRLRGRQSMGVFLAAGLPVYGWQQFQFVGERR